LTHSGQSDDGCSFDGSCTLGKQGGIMQPA
jgi:hypothetical protein